MLSAQRRTTVACMLARQRVLQASDVAATNGRTGACARQCARPWPWQRADTAFRHQKRRASFNCNGFGTYIINNAPRHTTPGTDARVVSRTHGRTHGRHGTARHAWYRCANGIAWYMYIYTHIVIKIENRLAIAGCVLVR